METPLSPRLKHVLIFFVFNFHLNEKWTIEIMRTKIYSGYKREKKTAKLTKELNKTKSSLVHTTNDL